MFSTKRKCVEVVFMDHCQSIGMSYLGQADDDGDGNATGLGKTSLHLSQSKGIDFIYVCEEPS